MNDREALVIRYLAIAPRRTAREVARALWPDSPGWQRRSHRHDGRAGALGAAMPMLAGGVLSKMLDGGYVIRQSRPKSGALWSASLAGLDAERAHTAAKSRRAIPDSLIDEMIDVVYRRSPFEKSP